MHSCRRISLSTYEVDEAGREFASDGENAYDGPDDGQWIHAEDSGRDIERLQTCRLLLLLYSNKNSFSLV